MVEIINGKLAPPNVLYYREVPSGGQANFDIYVPATYGALRLDLFGKTEDTDLTDGGDAVVIAFNGDTTATNYNYAHHAAGTGVTHLASVGNINLIGEIANVHGGVATNIGQITGYLGNYSGSLYKSMRCIYNISKDGNDYGSQLMLHWNNTAAITRITLTTESTDDFAEGTICMVTGF